MYINAFFITDITITIVTSELPHYQLVDQTFTAASIFFLAIKSINASSDRKVQYHHVVTKVYSHSPILNTFKMGLE